MLQLILISIGAVALLFVAIGLKVLLSKEQEVKKSCSSGITVSGEQLTCGCGGDSCDNENQKKVEVKTMN
ncbi:MAG: hypothetical protein K9J27_02775 [Bacteroidales bacterium]|nr:hypothetical protein [Bacteroidales bacterium]MCF8332862.1 hypothetical protein [Bacteroidales bacterium]